MYVREAIQLASLSVALRLAKEAERVLIMMRDMLITFFPSGWNHWLDCIARMQAARYLAGARNDEGVISSWSASQ